MDNLKENQKKLLACIRRADYDFGLIDDGDRIMIGLSGGKDSLALVKLLSLYQKFGLKSFSLVACHIDFGFPAVDFAPVQEFCKEEGVPYQEYDSKEVAQILEVHRTNKGLLPCSICSRMRKAVINKAANELGFKKVAFAHHMDDAIVTLFMNMTYGARVNTFEPKMHLEKADIDFIRPLIYAREKMIADYAKELSFPVTKNLCGNDKETQREVFKAWLKEFYHQHPDAYNNFSVMLTNSACFQLWFGRYGINPGDGLFIKEATTREDILDLAKIASLAKASEDFAAQDVYYLLRKNGVPLAYLKASIDHLDIGKYELLGLVSLPEAQEKDLLRMIDELEKKLASQHVPLTLNYGLADKEDLFRKAGYVENNGKLTKTLTQSLRF
jgi:tRNA 2-thiocytidine biosynthesis protein TtcA